MHSQRPFSELPIFQKVKLGHWLSGQGPRVSAWKVDSARSQRSAARASSYRLEVRILNVAKL